MSWKNFYGEKKNIFSFSFVFMMDFVRMQMKTSCAARTPCKRRLTVDDSRCRYVVAVNGATVDETMNEVMVARQGTIHFVWLWRRGNGYLTSNESRRRRNYVVLRLRRVYTRLTRANFSFLSSSLHISNCAEHTSGSSRQKIALFQRNEWK